jgi:glycosyltransferase involved in cell wall biosynthesis
MPSRSFLLIGKAWDAHPKFGEMLNLPNFKYVDTDYDDYPSHYAQMSVFVSPSRLEGGPIPLLEAMMSNVVPVASRTGFAPDIIVHGENGYLFDIGQSVGSICRLIDEAFALNCDVRSSVEAYTWSSFARAVRRVIELN